MHPVPGGQSAHKVTRVLESSMGRGQHDVAEQGQFRVAQGRPVDCGDYRHLDVQEVAQQVLALPVSGVPLGRSAARHGVAGACRTGKPVAHAGHDNHLGFRIRAHGVEHLHQFSVGTGAPLESVAVAVQGHLEDAVFPFQPGIAEAVLVFLKSCHEWPPSLF